MTYRLHTALRAPFMLFLLTLSLLLFAPRVQASCAPVLGSDLNINGVVANLGGSSITSCTGDQGWQGVIGRNFTVFGAPGTQNAWAFIAGRAGGASLSKVYVGLHVEGNAELNVDDKAVLYFDGNNNGEFGVGDFAIFFEIGTLTTASGTEECSKDPLTITFFKFQGGSPAWSAQATPAGAIVAKVGHDFSNVLPSDPENEIWELELELNVAVLNANGFTLNAPNEGGAFRMGAKLFVNDPGAGGTTVWRWPSTTTTESNPAANTPNLDTTVIAANLEPISFGNCGDVIIESISSEAPNAGGGYEPNKFRVLNPGDFGGGGAVPVEKQTRFHARLRFQTTPMGAPAAIGAPNTGNGIFSLMPWGTNGPLVEVIARNQAESFAQINVIKDIDFNWPLNKTQYDQANGFFNSQQSGHTCMKLRLQGFPVNINEPADQMQRNLSYIRTSTVKENFLITAERCSRNDKNYNECRGPQEFIIQTRWANVDPKMQCPPNPNAAQAKKCEQQLRWTYIFPTASTLGIKHLGKGYYRVVLKEGQTIKVPVTIIGGVMPTPPQKYKISPRAGGAILSPASGEPPVDVKVKPGQVLTVISTGMVNLGGIFKGRNSGPDGFSSRELTQQEREFLLQLGILTPSQHIASLIGSFDGFKTSFVVGSNSSLIVPEGTDTLSLAVNDLRGQYDDNTGDGFEANILIGDLVSLPTRVGLAGNPAFGLPGVVAAGANLPQLQIDAYRRIPTKIRRNAALRPAGYAVYAVYESHTTKAVPVRKAAHSVRRKR